MVCPAAVADGTSHTYMSSKLKDTSNLSNDESEGLSDIDDVEVTLCSMALLFVVMSLFKF